MQLSSETIQILKNFASINQSIILSQGSTIETMSVMKTILGSAKITESFPHDIPIYDLSQFLNCLNLVDNADLEFNEETNSLSIKNNSTSIEYRYSDPSVITSPPKKKLSLPDTDVTFTLSHETVQKLFKASSVLSLPDLSVFSKSGVLYVNLTDRKQGTQTNHFKVEVGSYSGDGDVTYYFDIDNLKLLAGDYDVFISKSLLSHWVHHSIPVTYWIPLKSV